MYPWGLTDQPPSGCRNRPSVEWGHGSRASKLKWTGYGDRWVSYLIDVSGLYCVSDGAIFLRVDPLCSFGRATGTPSFSQSPKDAVLRRTTWPWKWSVMNRCGWFPAPSSCRTEYLVHIRSTGGFPPVPPRPARLSCCWCQCIPV